MIWLGNKKINGVWFGMLVASMLYHSSQRVWSAIRSCFGGGVWIGQRPWVNRDVWKTN